MKTIGRMGALLSLAVSAWSFSMLDQIESQNYTIGEGNSGYYFPYDSSRNMWMLYMPAIDFLFVHPAGDNTNGERLSASDFDALYASGDSVVIGQYNGSGSEGYLLDEASYSISENGGGFYQAIDDSGEYWVLYLPTYGTVTLHEAGKTKPSEGAQTYNVSDSGIEVNYSGNQLVFGAIPDGLEEDSSSSTDSTTPATVEKDDGSVETTFAGITWLTPSDDTCKRYGDGYSIDGWQTTSIIMTESFSIDYCNSRGGRALAESVCNEVGARLPTMAEFTQLVEACGGVMEDYISNSGNTEYSECMQQARFEEQSYISSEVSGDQVLALDIAWGETRELDEGDDLVYRCVADSSITPTSSESSAASGSIEGMTGDGYATWIMTNIFDAATYENSDVFTCMEDTTVTCADLGVSADFSGSAQEYDESGGSWSSNALADGALCIEVDYEEVYSEYGLSFDLTCVGQTPLEEMMTE